MTVFPEFTQKDFDVFSIDGLDQRMEAIKTRIRPKLEQLGIHFAPILSLQTGGEMFFHVAKHARRTVNPPQDTWVAWAQDKRGYKKHPHFQIGLWGTHLFVWYAVIYESPYKEHIGQAMQKHLDHILQTIPSSYLWSPDHTQPGSTPQDQLGREGLQQLTSRLITVKKAELLCGINIHREDPILTDGQALLNRLEETFTTLTTLYNLGSPTSTVKSM